jgi:hypothetical protein
MPRARRFLITLRGRVLLKERGYACSARVPAFLTSDQEDSDLAPVSPDEFESTDSLSRIACPVDSTMPADHLGRTVEPAKGVRWECS